MKKCMTALLVSAALAFGGTPAHAAAALPKWGPWMLCATPGPDYHARVHVIPFAGDWIPDVIQTRRAGTAAPAAYDTIGLEWYDGSWRLDGWDYPTTRTTKGVSKKINSLDYPPSDRPAVQVWLTDGRGTRHVCNTQTVAVN